jgi:CheY-like chemotaxis protein
VTRADDAPLEPPANVLLVDDRPENLLSLEAVLAGPGRNLVRASSGEEALRHLLADDFAVVLLDLRMPGLSGFEAARLIRGRDRSRHTPIIFLTAAETPDFPVAEAYKLGAVDYLVRPLLPEVLRAKVAGFVELFRKTERLRRLERDEGERRLAQEKQRWELERSREEAARQQRRAEELAGEGRRKDEFLALLAHELRNPLAPIRHAAEVLRRAGRDPALAGQARGVIERQVAHLARLVEDLLDVSRVTHGKITLHKERVHLADIVARAVDARRQGPRRRVLDRLAGVLVDGAEDGREGLAGRVRGRPAGQGFGGRVQEGHPPADVGDDHGVARAGQSGAGPGRLHRGRLFGL